MGTVATLLDEHVSFRCTSVDRIGVRGYIPGLQYEGGVVKFLLNRGGTIPSPALLNRNRERLVAELEALEEGTGVPVVRFKAGESKEDIARPHQDEAAAAGRPGLVLVGKAQERTSAWRGYVDDTHVQHRSSHPHIAWRRQSTVPDHWYFYFADPEWGPAFLKICSYAPYPLWCCANGHEWAKCQLAKAGIGFEALDNGLRSVEDPAVAHRICARLGAGHLRGLLARMMAVVPDPLCAHDRAAGFEWSFSLAQFEVSDTAVFDQPRRARAWFEVAIGDHLDLGRPERVSLLVDRTVVNRGKMQDPGTLRHRGHHPRHRPPAPDPLQVVEGQGLSERRPGPARRDHGQQRQRLRPAQDPQRRELELHCAASGPTPTPASWPRSARDVRGFRTPPPSSRSSSRASTTASAPRVCASETPGPWPYSALSPPSPTSSAD